MTLEQQIDSLAAEADELSMSGAGQSWQDNNDIQERVGELYRGTM